MGTLGWLCILEAFFGLLQVLNVAASLEILEICHAQPSLETVNVHLDILLLFIALQSVEVNFAALLNVFHSA